MVAGLLPLKRRRSRAFAAHFARVIGVLSLAITASCASRMSRPGGGAVQILVTEARQARGEGRLDDASASLERALRLEPRNAALWHELALVRRAQDLHGEAETLALRSIALAGDDRDLVRANWLLVAECRRAQGDVPGASAAEAEAESR